MAPGTSSVSVDLATADPGMCALVRGPDEITTIRVGDETFIIRAEPAGMPQGFAMASQTMTMLTLLWKRLIRGERGWRLRVRRYADDPAGAVLHEVASESRDEARERLDQLSHAIRQGDFPWKSHT